jgi:hypothetical protein
MSRRRTSALPIIVLACVAAGSEVGAQSQPSNDPGVLAAEEVGKEYAPDTSEAGARFQNRQIRVAGEVSMAHEPFVYLLTGSKFPTGQPVLVTVDFRPGAFPGLKRGDRIVVEGRVDRKGIFGPVLTGSRILTEPAQTTTPRTAGEPTTKRSAPTRKGRTPRRTGGPSEVPQAGADGAAIPLRCDGPVLPGEPGFRPQWSSYRLRFAPGAWQGTKLGRSIAWGDGNDGHDFWGEGSGEKTSCSEVDRDAEGFFFIFSLHGTDWDSTGISALIRLTLPNGRHAVAAAVFPSR